MGYIREDQAYITVVLDGVKYPLGGDSWASVEGGNLEADDAKTRPGGMGREVAVGGPASRDDLTVAIQFSDITSGWVPAFENRVGVGAVEVGVTYLGPERTPVGRPRTTRGILKGLSTPDQASDSSDVGMFEITVSCHEQSA